MTNPHQLWSTGEEGCPKVICDNHGQVVLDLCKVCGKRESELDLECRIKVSSISTKRAKTSSLEAKKLDSHANPKPNLLTWCLRQSLYQLYNWRPYY
jgi:hypothetical protein